MCALFAGRLGFEIYPEQKAGSAERRMEARQMNEAEPTAVHACAFVGCVRTRKQPPADAETAHRSTIVAHLGNIAFNQGGS